MITITAFVFSLPDRGQHRCTCCLCRWRSRGCAGNLAPAGTGRGPEEWRFPWAKRVWQTCWTLKLKKLWRCLSVNNLKTNQLRNEVWWFYAMQTHFLLNSVSANNEPISEFWNIAFGRIINVSFDVILLLFICKYLSRRSQYNLFNIPTVTVSPTRDRALSGNTFACLRETHWVDARAESDVTWHLENCNVIRWKS